MGLFDDNILDVEYKELEIFDNYEKKVYSKWITYIKSLPKTYGKNIYEQIQIHNFEDDIDDIDTLTFRFVSYKSLPNTILCPLEFILDSPRFINFLALDNIDTNYSNGVTIIWYTFREYNDNDVKERIITKEDINVLNIIEYPENSTLPVKHIIIRATFDCLDTYMLFASKIHNNFPDAEIHIHYDSKIYINNKPVSITSVFYTHDLKSIHVDCNIDINYQSFPVNGAEIKYKFLQ